MKLDDQLKLVNRQFDVMFEVMDKLNEGNREAQHEQRSRLDHALMDIRAGKQLEEMGDDELDALASHAENILQDRFWAREEKRLMENFNFLKEPF